MIKIKSPNFLFGSFYSSLKNALLKKSLCFTSYMCKLTMLVTYYLLKKHYFSNVELYQLNLVNNKKAVFLFITINYDEDSSAFNTVSLLYSKTYTKYYTYKQLLLLSKIERSLFIVSTSVGILNTSESIMYKIGGIPLIELF